MQSDESISSKRFHFHLIDVTSGLSNNFVNDIQQDSLGFIWVSTFDGLNRYDGTNFVQFKEHFDSTKTGLSNNFVKELKLLNHSELLIATDNGLDIYNFKSKSFRVINTQNGLINNSVSAIGFTPDNKVLIGTYRGAIQVANGDWALVNLPNQDRLSSTEISSLATQSDSIIWVGTYDGGLTKINYFTKNVTPIPYGQGSNFPSPIINKLYTDTKRNLWVGSREGIQVITKAGDTLQIAKTSSPSTGLSDNDILGFAEDGLGNIWIGTRNGGLNILNINSLLQADEKLNIRWFLPRTDGFSVYNRTVSAIMRDQDGNMWLGTPTGINYVKPTGEAVELIQRNLTTKNSISHDRIGALTSSKNKKIWIGTDGSGLDLYEPKKGVIKHYEHQENNRNSLNNNYILSLLEDKKGHLWVGTYRGGLHKIMPETNHINHYLEGSPSQGSDVRVIYESGNGIIWVGTNRGGLYKYMPESDGFLYIESLGKLDIRDIDEDQNGNLWMATYGSGIIRFNPGQKSIKIYNQQNTANLTSDVIFSIMMLDDNDLLCGTRYGGLIRMDITNDSIRNFTTMDGLSNNTICSLIEENDTYVWMGTYHGISRYNVHTNEIIDLTALNNIQNGEFNIGAVAKNDSGILFFGGNNGLNLIKTANFDRSEKPPALIFNQLKVLNQEVKVGPEKGAILNQAIAYKNKISLKHNQNSFSIGFTALKYPEAKNISYSYKLENHNDFWVDTQGIGIANFTNVPPGDYILKVKMNTGFEQSTQKELQIAILPPFWKTWIAYSLYFVVTFLFIWLILKYYSERIRLKNSLLFEKKQRQLEHDLNEERLRFFTAFSHELKTSLTLVIAPLENLITRAKGKEIKERLLFIRKNGKKLFQSINQLLELRKSEEGLSKLDISEHNLPNKLQKWIESYQPLARGKNIKLTATIKKEKVLFSVDLEKIEIIVNNLLSNAIKYSKKGGKVHVDFSHDQQYFKISVCDAGIGIIQDELENIFNWYYRSNSTLKKSGTGIGLALSRHFAELHNGTIQVQSIPNKITEFTLTIPIRHNQNQVDPQEVKQKFEQEISLTLDVVPPPASTIVQNARLTSKDRPLILIIDDNPDMLYFLNDICKHQFDVQLAVDGIDGIQKATQYIPNLIISDVMMPEKDGIDVCSNLKNQHSTSHIPIILLTAKNNFESITLGYQEGADDYITKPFHPQLLLTRIHNLLRSRLRLQKYFLNKSASISPEVTNEENQLLGTEKKFLLKLDAIIEKHIKSESDSVDIIAKEVGMSRTSLYRKLKAITGMNINQYIRNLKIEIAAELIQNDKLSISQASYEVGFTNIKYFRKVFKEKYGKNPSEFKA